MLLVGISKYTNTNTNINILFQENPEEIVDAEEPVETLTISDDLAKTHFPELLEQKTEVFEVTDKEGEVVEQFRAVEQNPEELLTNVEALEKMEIEAINEGLFKVHKQYMYLKSLKLLQSFNP